MREYAYNATVTKIYTNIVKQNIYVIFLEVIPDVFIYNACIVSLSEKTYQNFI